MKDYVIIILQIIIIGLVFTGLMIESYYHADVGYIFITAGAFMFAIVEKLDKHRIKRRIK